MKWEQVVRLGSALPEVAEGLWFRTPALEVRGKSFVRLKEDGLSVVFLVANADDQEMLLATQPAVYFITDHYRGHGAVLARLDTLRPDECRLRLEHAWRLKAPKKLVKQLDEKNARKK